MEKINVAELLKDCPKGMELDCTMFNNVVLYGVNGSSYPISILAGGRKQSRLNLTKTGCCNNNPDAKCVIFPKGKTTWEGFQRPFKDGDILAYTSSHTTVFIYRNKDNEPKHTTSFYVGYTIGCRCYCNFHIYDKSTLIALNGDCDTRFATEEEKQKLFEEIKERGYKWNPETKTLEKLPKFKVGDKITNGKTSITIGYIDIDNGYYYEISRNIANRLFIKNQDEWDLVPNKFDINTLKPFDKVLVRNSDSGFWQPTFWGIYEVGKSNEHQYRNYLTTKGFFRHCIPYNDDTKHLLGTTNDCDEYFKTWE